MQLRLVWNDFALNVIWLICFFYAGSLAETEMGDLRKAMPSIPHVLEKLHSNPGNHKLSKFSQQKQCKYKVQILSQTVL